MSKKDRDEAGIVAKGTIGEVEREDARIVEIDNGSFAAAEESLSVAVTVLVP